MRKGNLIKKKYVLRWDSKDDVGLDSLISSGRSFLFVRAPLEKALSPLVFMKDASTDRSLLPEDRKFHDASCGIKRSDVQAGVRRSSSLSIINKILKSIQKLTMWIVFLNSYICSQYIFVTFPQPFLHSFIISFVHQQHSAVLICAVCCLVWVNLILSFYQV